MKHLVDLVKLDRLDKLIRLKATGKPEELAKRMEMSRTSLFELIAYLRDKLDAPIKYNYYDCSYEYAYLPKFYLGFEEDRFKDIDFDSIYGGKENNNKTENSPDDE